MSESLRDQLSAAVLKVEAEAPAAEPAPQVETPAETHEVSDKKPADAAPAEESKPGRTAGRSRDEQGRLLPGPAVKAPVVAAPEVAAAPEVKRPARPSSWKKDYWEHWDKLDPKLAEYIHQRESEYAKGVSTYKAEWDKSKPFLDAVAPYQAELQQHGIDPAQQFGKYMEIHKALAFGSPEQKLGVLLRVAQDYQIPLQNLFVQQEGQVFYNPQVKPAALQQQAQQQKQADPRQTVRDILAEERAALEVADMERNTQKYPHYETVKGTMSGLLQGGLAQDLSSAYEAAIRMPQHSEIFEAQQQQQRAQEESERKAAEAKRVAAAKAAAVSVRSATPTGAAGGGKKGLRSTYEEALSDAEGRV